VTQNYPSEASGIQMQLMVPISPGRLGRHFPTRFEPEPESLGRLGRVVQTLYMYEWVLISPHTYRYIGASQASQLQGPWVWRVELVR
jgi:hypothetical protein